SNLSRFGAHHAEAADSLQLPSVRNGRNAVKTDCEGFPPWSIEIQGVLPTAAQNNHRRFRRWGSSRRFARMDDVRERFLNLHEFLKAAKFNLNRNNWDYIIGATETETTLARNRQSLDSIAFKPRVLRNVQNVDCSSELFGRKVRLPVMIAPVGGLQNFWAGGVATVAQAAGEFGVPVMQSSATEPPVEETAKKVPDAFKIFQLYARGDDDYVDGFYKRAQDNGYAPQFCFTVDLAYYSRRERDVVKRFNRIANRSEREHHALAGLDWAMIERFQKRH